MPDNEDKFERELGRRSSRNKNFRELDWMTEAQTKKLINIEFEQKLNEFFRNIGYDIKEYEEIKALRQDLQFLHGLRESSQERKSTVLKGIITSFIGIVLGSLMSFIIWLLSSHSNIPSNLPKP